MSNNEKMIDQQEEPELIDISATVDDMWKGFKHFWVLLLIIVVVCAGISYMKSKMEFVPYYTASATYTVRAESSNSSNMNMQTAAELGTSMQYILTSKVLQTMVAEKMEVASVPGTIYVAVMEGTNLFTINVDSEDPEAAYAVLQTVIETYPEVAQTVIGTTELELVDESGVPASPANIPDYRRKLEMGAAVGVLIDLIILLVFALTRKTIKKEEDFKAYLNVECFGVVPRARFKRRGKKRGTSSLVLMDNKYIPSGYREAINIVRNRLERKLRDDSKKVILVTSAIAGEGKSTIAANIALSLAKKGKNVILADLDLRNPSLAKVMGLEVDNGGMIDVIRGKKDWKEAILQYKEESVYVVAGGRPINNTSRTLTRNSLREVVDEMKKDVDYLILDTPPSAIVSDAALIADLADAAIFVARQDFARTDRILEGIRNLAETNIEICGCILNQAEVGVTGYGYSRSYGYGRYGYGYAEKKYGYGYGQYGYGGKKDKENEEEE